MTTILVKDSEWFREAYNMPNRVTVHVGHTRKQFEEMTREEANKRNYDYIMGYSGNDEHNYPETDDVEEVDLA